MKKAKYVWSDKGFDDWIKEQVRRAEQNGIRTSSSGVTRLLMNAVIEPNNIKLFDKPKKIKIKIKI